MAKSKEKSSRRTWKQRPKVLKARYDANSHFTAFDIRATRLNGKPAGVLGRGTFEGKNSKGVNTLLTRVAETFACRELHLERVGDRKAAGTFVEIIKSNGQQHV